MSPKRCVGCGATLDAILLIDQRECCPSCGADQDPSKPSPSVFDAAARREGEARIAAAHETGNGMIPPRPFIRTTGATAASMMAQTLALDLDSKGLKAALEGASMHSSDLRRGEPPIKYSREYLGKFLPAPVPDQPSNPPIAPQASIKGKRLDFIIVDDPIDPEAVALREVNMLTPFSVHLVDPPVRARDPDAAEFTRLDCIACCEDLDDSPVLDLADLGTSVAGLTVRHEAPWIPLNDTRERPHHADDRVICKHCEDISEISELGNTCPDDDGATKHQLKQLLAGDGHDMSCSCGWQGRRHPRMIALSRAFGKARILRHLSQSRQRKA